MMSSYSLIQEIRFCKVELKEKEKLVVPSTERRRPEGFKLRIYIDAIREAEALTNEEWISNWAANCTVDSEYLSQYNWICLLRKWALQEAHKLALSSPPTALNFD